MSFTVEVKDAVKEFVSGKKLFTSVDVANEIKKAGVWRRNREVAHELRDLFSNGDDAFDGYDRCNIAVDAGSKTATLYLPCGADPEDYKDRDQKAIGPKTVTVPQSTRPAGTAPTAPQATSPKVSAKVFQPMILKRARRDKKTIHTDSTDIADVLDTDIVMSKVIKTKERIKIPAPMIRKLGWTPGQAADLSRIKTHNEVRVGVIVSKDYRVSIPRNAVKWGANPVKVMLTDDNNIIFDKA
jgi:hypothetical protein